MGATTVKRNLPPNQQSPKYQLPKPVQTTPAGDRPEATKERSTADEAATGLPKGPASGADVKILKASLPLLHAQKSAERAHCKQYVVEPVHQLNHNEPGIIIN